MGVASIHGIVHDYDGHILVETQLGKGATMKILFPPLKEQPTSSYLALPAASEHNQSPLEGRALVVDDDADVSDFTRDLLREWRLSVTLFNESLEACRHFAADPARYDLVILDQTMLKMTGLEAGKEMLKHRPDILIILHTGYSEEVSEAVIQTNGIRALVKKPIQVEHFYSLIAKLLTLPMGIAD
jgi:CheY-like chemotaxis protein